MSITRELMEVEKEISDHLFAQTVLNKDLSKLRDTKVELLKEFNREVIEPVALKLNYKVRVTIGDQLSQEAGLSPKSLLNWDGPENAGLMTGFENKYLRDYVYNWSEEPLSFFLWKGEYQNTGGLVLRYLEKDVYDNNKPSMKVFPLSRLGGYVEETSPGRYLSWPVNMEDDPVKSLTHLIKKYEIELFPTL